MLLIISKLLFLRPTNNKNNNIPKALLKFGLVLSYILAIVIGYNDIATFESLELKIAKSENEKNIIKEAK